MQNTSTICWLLCIKRESKESTLLFACIFTEKCWRYVKEQWLSLGQGRELNRWGTRVGGRFFTKYMIIFWGLEPCECVIYSNNFKVKFKIITVYCGSQNKPSALVLHTFKSWCPCGALQNGCMLQGPPPSQWPPWLAVVLQTRMHICIVQNGSRRPGLWVPFRAEPAPQMFWDLSPLCTGQLQERNVLGGPSTEYSNTEASAAPCLPGRSGGSDPEWRNLRSPGWVESSPC